MNLDVEEELKKVENSLRDFISFVLMKELGEDWTKRVKFSPDRIDKWKERKETELKRLQGSALEDRLIYYSDFYDLRELIRKNWCVAFKETFKDIKNIETYLIELENLRDPNAHRRELFEYQKNLILGISGDIRTRIMKYRGKKEDVDDYFPKVESVNDSLGNMASNTNYAQTIASKIICRVGDIVEIKVFSTDPLGGELEYSIERIQNKNWTNFNKQIITFKESDIGKTCDINIMIRSKRNFYAYSDFDDYVMLRYMVLPREF